MTILDQILEKDRQLLIFLNALGSENWDIFWLNITNKYLWIPLYIGVLILFIKFFNWKKIVLTLFIVALLVTFTDQFVNLIKAMAGRLRPCNDESILHLIRVVKHSGGYSFLSGHAANSFAVSTFVILILRQHFKPVYFILVWPFLFAYSRIYLGVHFPLDVFFGVLLGILIGFVFHRLQIFVSHKINLS